MFWGISNFLETTPETNRSGQRRKCGNLSLSLEQLFPSHLCLDRSTKGNDFSHTFINFVQGCTHFQPQDTPLLFYCIYFLYFIILSTNCYYMDSNGIIKQPTLLFALGVGNHWNTCLACNAQCDPYQSKWKFFPKSKSPFH